MFADKIWFFDIFNFKNMETKNLHDFMLQTYQTMRKT